MGQVVIDALVLCSVYVLFSLGLTLSWGALDILNMAHGAFMMFAAFIAYLVVGSVALPLWLLFIIGTASAGLMTLTLDVLVFRRIRAKSADRRQAELLVLIAGVGVASIPETIATAHTSGAPFGIGHLSWHSFALGAHTSISAIQIIIIAFGVVLASSVAFVVTRTKYGRALRAVAFDRETAESLGINANILSAVTMFVAGALAGIAGMLLVVYLGALGPDTGSQFMIEGFSIIILGGIGSIWGTVAGAAVVAATEAIVTQETSGSWVNAISFAVILVVILCRPQGLFGRGMAERV